MKTHLKKSQFTKGSLLGIFICLYSIAHAQLPPCDPGFGNMLTQTNNSVIYVDINSNNCKALVPAMLGRWSATPGPGFALISISQAPSSSTQITMNGGGICSDQDVDVYIEAIFFYFGDPLDPSDDILCSIVKGDFFHAQDVTPPTFVNFGDMTINVTTDCQIDAADVKLLLKNAHVKDNCTSKDYLVSNSWVSRCDMGQPPNPECPEDIQCWTFHIADACGNMNEKDIQVTIQENVPPVITLPASFTLNANANCLITDAQLKALVTAAHVSDNCTSDATLLNNLTVIYGGFECIMYTPGEPMVTCPYNPEGVYCYTFNTTDACGNVSNDEVVSIYVKDVTAPVLTPPANFEVCWPDPNYPFQNFTDKPTVFEACDADCDITCLIYSQRILSLTNPTKGAYGNNVYPTILINPGPRVAKIRVCAQDLCGNGALNPPLNAPLPANCCTFLVTLLYDEGCMPPLRKIDEPNAPLSKLEGVSQEVNLNEMDTDPEWYLGAYPNPVVKQTLIHFNLPAAESYHVKIYNQTGKQLWAKTGNGEKGRNVLALDRGDLAASGLVYCRVETKNKSETLLLYLIN